MLLADLLPVTVYIAAYDIKRYSLTFPSGKTIILYPDSEYVTSDKEEIEFLSKQKGLGITRPTDSKEKFLRHVAATFAEKPTLENLTKKSEEELSLFMLSNMSEDLVITYLRNRGYQGELIKKIEELGKEIEAETEQIPEEIKEGVSDAEDKESDIPDVTEQPVNTEKDTIKKTNHSNSKSL